MSGPTQSNSNNPRTGHDHQEPVKKQPEQAGIDDKLIGKPIEVDPFPSLAGPSVTRNTTTDHKVPNQKTIATNAKAENVLISSIFKSNTTYSSLANVIWSVTTSVPEAAIAHAILGVKSLWNEYQAKLKNGSSQPDSLSYDSKLTPLTSLLNSAGLSRTVQGVIFATSSFVSLMRGNVIDAACFVGCTLAVSAVAHQMNVQSNTRLRLPEVIERLRTKLWNPVPNFFKQLAKDPAPGWLIADAIIGVRNISGVFTNECSSTVNIFAVIGIGIIPIGMTLVALKALGKLKLPAELPVNLAAAQHISFSMANFLSGNILLGTCAALWATAGILVGRTIKENQKN